jgi:hypothetical protein
MDNSKPESATIDAVQRVGTMETSDTVTPGAKDNDVGDVAPILTGTDAHTKPKPQDEPFKTSDTVTPGAKDNDVGDIAPILTGTDAHNKPKSLDEPFKIRYACLGKDFVERLC